MNQQYKVKGFQLFQNQDIISAANLQLIMLLQVTFSLIEKQNCQANETKFKISSSLLYVYWNMATNIVVADGMVC